MPASAIAKRQEVGRGLRICVDQNGVRMDLEELGEEQEQDINKLTVIANESYSTFVADLQRETREALRERPTKATLDYFQGKKVKSESTPGVPYIISEQDALMITGYLLSYGYIDKKTYICSVFSKKTHTY